MRREGVNIRAAVQNGLPVFGTCAGMVLLAGDVEGNPAERIGRMDIKVKRNACGRQLDSFGAVSSFADFSDYPMIFIRAPGLVDVGENVEILAEVNGEPVAVR